MIRRGLSGVIGHAVGCRLGKRGEQSVTHFADVIVYNKYEA